MAEKWSEVKRGGAGMSTNRDRDLDGMTRAELVQVIRDQRAEVEQLRALAKAARSQAAAPEYDEQAIRDSLWALVDATSEVRG